MRRVAAQRRLPSGSPGPAVFTAGYSGHTPDSFVALLEEAQVRQVLDVRSRPFSRKAGFSKRALSEFMGERGLAYAHLPALGAPPEMLDKKSDGAPFSKLVPTYRRHLAGQPGAIKEAEALARSAPSALICLENDPKECHRGILAEEFVKRGWTVIHL